MMFDVMARVDDYVAAVERIATALERIEANTERIAELYGNVVGTYKRDDEQPSSEYRAGADASNPANVLRSVHDDDEAGA